jgi:hypothetical protein
MEVPQEKRRWLKTDPDTLNSERLGGVDKRAK